MSKNIISVFLFLISCSGTSEYEWETITAVTYINETTDTIFVRGFLCDTSHIAPEGRKTFEYQSEQYGTSKKDYPTLENYEFYVPCDFFYGNTATCERNIDNVLFREDFK